MTANRQTIRETIASGLSAAVTSAQAVYTHASGDIAGQSPVLRVLSAGSLRQPLSQRGNRALFYLTIQVWVLYADPDAGYTEQNAEDALDQIENQIAAWLASSNSIAQVINFAGRSAVTAVDLGGEAYMVEEIPLEVSVPY